MFKITKMKCRKHGSAAYQFFFSSEDCKKNKGAGFLNAKLIFIALNLIRQELYCYPVILRLTRHK